MFLFYVVSFFKKGDTIQGGTLFKEIRYYLEIDNIKSVISESFLLWLFPQKMCPGPLKRENPMYFLVICLQFGPQMKTAQVCRSFKG